jgi:hypothetical protein
MKSLDSLKALGVLIVATFLLLLLPAVTAIADSKEIVGVDPDSATRGSSLWIDITGQGTHFEQGSSTVTTVRFWQGTATITASQVVVQSLTSLTALMDIPTWAPKGLWDVWVQTTDYPTEILEEGFTIWDCYCRPGDADNNGVIAISDAVYLINYIFVPEAPAPIPYAVCSGDYDCNGIVNISDAIGYIIYIFAGGPPPCTCEEWVAANGAY